MPFTFKFGFGRYVGEPLVFTSESGKEIKGTVVEAGEYCKVKWEDGMTSRYYRKHRGLDLRTFERVLQHEREFQVNSAKKSGVTWFCG